MEFVPLLGYIPILGWEQSGGEIMTAVVEIVYRLVERGGAGAGRGRTVAFVSWVGCEGRHVRGSDGTGGTWWAGHFRLGTCYQYRHPVDEACCWGGALRGRSPRTREGRIGPTAQRRGESGEERGVRGRRRPQGLTGNGLCGAGAEGVGTRRNMRGYFLLTGGKGSTIVQAAGAPVPLPLSNVDR